MCQKVRQKSSLTNSSQKKATVSLLDGRRLHILERLSRPLEAWGLISLFNCTCGLLSQFHPNHSSF